ncbi:polysaccharide biosynthesis protein [Flavimaricola marinus]|uniref:polysaccharide biosynthesis protein n=1 Tax=Flavimaricola marinus TaxID=1819565 RepID=UPI001FE9E19C|nr:nucleoside-diphosphate sugar epimerase/dehydratase [Flavimaricola marinus]
MSNDLLLKIVADLPRPIKQATIVALDIALLPIAMVLALALQQNRFPPAEGLLELWMGFVILMTIAGLLSVVLGIHKVQLKAYETRALGMTAAHVLVIGLAAAIIDGLSGRESPISTAIIFAFVYFGMCASSRYLLLKLLRWIYDKQEDQVRVLIYGAGRMGQQLVAALKTDDTIVPIAFVDDSKRLHSTIVKGLTVYSSASISTLVSEKKVDRVLLAMPSQTRARLAQISAKLEGMGLTVESLPSFSQLAGNGAKLVEQLRPVQPGQFLGRPPLDSELPGGSETYAGRSILVTGAGGSIGSELCKQLVLCKPRRLVLMEISELALYNINNELAELARHQGVELIPSLGSVTDAPIVRRVLSQHSVDVVIHAAAYKHVPIVERDPVPGFANNVLGTHTLATAAAEAQVARFILISTDKAVRPKNMMGASKRLAEMVIQDLAKRANPEAGDTIFSMVRFGNVIGSSGSVIPLFEEQIARGGPVTVTHPDVTRFFMTIAEAARLVLVAGSLAKGGDLFVLDMGEPIRIYDLAQQMIAAAGYEQRTKDNPGGDIEIQLTGLRPGEKLFEELLIGEGQTSTPHPKILQAREAHLSEIEVAACIKAIRAAVAEADDDAIRKIVSRWVESGKRIGSLQSIPAS